jgi:hypothetical protein
MTPEEHSRPACAELLTDIDGVSSRPVRRIVLLG